MTGSIDFPTEPKRFREIVRDWLAEHCPAAMRTPMPDEEVVWGGRNPTFARPEAEQWLRDCANAGLTAPDWPVKYGGAGLDKARVKILNEELARISARPPLFSFGLWMFGPALIEFGSEEQKLRYLPDIAAGKTRWCQGYSEPGAGSDLAGLRTRCENKGDHYLINGQKVWTSFADQADWIFCLVRTDTTVKHKGISFIVFDMQSEGVEARPIKLISGSSPFCETFFTDVKVPKDQMIGELNSGWTIAKRLLQYERNSISGIGFGSTNLPSPQELAVEHAGLDENGKLIDTDLRNRIVDQMIYQNAFELTLTRVAEQSKAGMAVGHTASVLKYAAAKSNQQRTELAVESLGNLGFGWNDDQSFPQDALQSTRAMLRAKGNSIEGGTSEVQLNIISKHVLELPDHKADGAGQ